MRGLTSNSYRGKIHAMESKTPNLDTDYFGPFFAVPHLLPMLAELSAPFALVAEEMLRQLPPTPERTAGMRKLLEAKDCFVRGKLLAMRLQRQQVEAVQQNPNTENQK